MVYKTILSSYINSSYIATIDDDADKPVLADVLVADSVNYKVMKMLSNLYDPATDTLKYRARVLQA